MRFSRRLKSTRTDTPSTTARPLMRRYRYRSADYICCRDVLSVPSDPDQAHQASGTLGHRDTGTSLPNASNDTFGKDRAMHQRHPTRDEPDRFPVFTNSLPGKCLARESGTVTERSRKQRINRRLACGTKNCASARNRVPTAGFAKVSMIRAMAATGNQGVYPVYALFARAELARRAR